MIGIEFNHSSKLAYLEEECKPKHDIRVVPANYAAQVVRPNVNARIGVPVCGWVEGQ